MIVLAGKLSVFASAAERHGDGYRYLKYYGSLVKKSAIILDDWI